METPDTTNTPMRTIHVRSTDKARIEAYLYSNFAIAEVCDDMIIVNGHDWAGFTAQAVSDRLWSGMIGNEIVR
jgi:hypothetical protein